MQWLWIDNNDHPTMRVSGITPARKLFPKGARSDKMAA